MHYGCIFYVIFFVFKSIKTSTLKITYLLLIKYYYYFLFIFLATHSIKLKKNKITFLNVFCTI